MPITGRPPGRPIDSGRDHGREHRPAARRENRTKRRSPPARQIAPGGFVPLAGPDPPRFGVATCGDRDPALPPSALSREPRVRPMACGASGCSQRPLQPPSPAPNRRRADPMMHRAPRGVKGFVFPSEPGTPARPRSPEFSRLMVLHICPCGGRRRVDPGVLHGILAGRGIRGPHCQAGRQARVRRRPLPALGSGLHRASCRAGGNRAPHTPTLVRLHEIDEEPGCCTGCS